MMRNGTAFADIYQHILSIKIGNDKKLRCINLSKEKIMGIHVNLLSNIFQRGK
jgi:hypothetical protein